MKKSVDMVLTTKEASTEFGIADCTIRQWMDQKLLDESDYRKSGSTWLMDRIAFINLLRRKKLHGKVFEVEGKKITFEYLGYKSKQLNIWYENQRVRTVLTNMPFANAVSEAYLACKEDMGLDYKYLMIIDESEVSDNWFYRKNKTWVITLRFVLETIIKTLANQGLNIVPLEKYLKENQL
ncbi:helix-turn-helix domain-containing protein (plasmid) [Brevibacillus halotolerans]|nr:helix-turn-helix domain-containing protein [Brevibacillus halotolerans]